MIKKIGSSKKQEITGIPTIKYGWVDKNDRRVFYSLIGVHCKLRTDEMVNTLRIERKLKESISKLIREFFPDIRFNIIDIDIPINITNTGKGFVGVELMIHNKKVVKNLTIEEFNGRVVDILLMVPEFSVHKTNKYL